MLLGLSLVLSTPSAAKTQRFLQSPFNSTLQLINYISSDLQKLLRYFNGTAIVFFKIPSLLFGAGSATVSPTNLVLYLKDLKA